MTYHDDEPVYEWSSNMEAGARYEVYGGSFIEPTFSSEKLKIKNDEFWKSRHNYGARGVKVIFVDEVTVTNFKATFKLFEQ